MANKRSVTLKSKKDPFDLFDGRIKVYRTTSQVWQMQMWISEEQKYVRESLKTTDKDQAILKAEDRYVYFRAKIKENEKVFSVTADELRNAFLKHIAEQVKQNQLSEGRQANIKTYTKHYLAFVGKTSRIQNIDRKKFREYLAFRRTKKSDILATVVANESVTIKQMYRFAASEGLIDQTYIPDFGVIKRNHNEAVRESFSTTEYDQLINVSKDWYKKKDVLDEEDRYYRRLLNDFIIVMANGGFRTQEARLLKWKDIRRVVQNERKDETFAEVVVRAENTKTRKSRTTEVRRGDVFERIKKYSKYTEQQDYVFSQFDKNAVLDKARLYDYFNALVAIVKAKHSDFDDSRTLYCLRHLFITMRILAGMNVYDIAKITGTSLLQIQKHYDAASSLVTSQKMNKNSLRFDAIGGVIVDVGGN
jgi:integrase